MDLQTQKLNLIEEVLRAESSELIEQVTLYFKSLTQAAANDADDLPIMPFRSKAEIEARLEQARADAKAGRTYTTEEVLVRLEQQRAA